MNSILDLFRKKEDEKSKASAVSDDQQTLIEEYRKVISDMKHIRNQFENITEPELIESCVHEMNSLQSRHAFLLSKLKEENLTAQEASWVLH